MRGHKPPTLPDRARVGSLEELLDKLAAATLDLNGADRSSLRGWTLEPGDGDGDGVRATYPGTLHVGEDLAADLRRAIDGAPLDDEARLRVRTGLKRLLRESIRLVSSDPEDHQGSAEVARHRWAQVLDHGVAEAWARDHLDELIDKFGLDEIIPGIKDVRALDEYDTEVAAARALCAERGSRTDDDPALVLQWVNRHDTPSKVALITAEPFELSRLRWLVPEHSRHTAELAAEAAMTRVLDRVPETGGADAVDLSARLGRQSIAGLYDKLGELREEYGNPALLELLDTTKHVDAALKVSGAGHSSFEGHVGEAPKPSRDFVVYGVSTWTNTMLLSSQHVVQLLREMYADPGKQHGEEKLKQFRRAVATLLHENGHLLAPEGQLNSDSERISKNHWARHAEEAFTNAWTERNLDKYIVALGIDKVAPGILDVRHQMTYPHLTNAAHAVADGIGRMGADSDEVLRQVNNETTVLKLETVAGMIYDQAGLDDVVPHQANARWLARREIVETLRHGFAWLDENTGRGTGDQVRAMSRLRGEQTFRATLAKVEEIKTRYTGSGGRAAMAAHSGVTPPGGGAPGAPGAPGAAGAAASSPPPHRGRPSASTARGSSASSRTR